MSTEGELEEEKEIETADIQVIAFCVLVASVFIGYCYHTYNRFSKIERFCPHASANMIFGFIVGAIVAAIGDLAQFFSFDSELFFTYILPPIIFSAGYNLPKDFFFHNFGSIIMFAFIGTTLSAFFIGSLLYAFGSDGTQDSQFPNLDFTKSMMLGSLISAVDPVAVILVLKSLNIDEQLKIILFGESVLNDAAAVVINRVFVSIDSDERSAESALSLAVFEIAGIAVASIFIGVICALVVAFIHKRSRMDHHKSTELASFLLGAFIPYAIAESLDLSGIMAVLFAGIMADYYTSHHLSLQTEASSRQMVQTLAYLAESFIFIYLGMSFFLTANHDFRGSYIVVTIVLCFIGRAISVFPLAWILNLGRKHAIPFKHQIVLWYAGLRGPVAFALAVATPEDASFPSADNIITSTTLIVVAFTTLMLGGFAFPFLKVLNVPLMDSTKEQKTDHYDISNHWFSRLDRRFLKPLFGPQSRVARPSLPMSNNIHVELDEETPDRVVGSNDDNIDNMENDNMDNMDNDDHRHNNNNNNNNMNNNSGNSNKNDRKNDRNRDGASLLNNNGNLKTPQPLKIDRDDFSAARTNNPTFLDNPRELSQSQTWSENPARDFGDMNSSGKLDLPTQQVKGVTPPPKSPTDSGK